VIVAGYVLLVFVFTFLATVHWLPLRGEEPAMAARRGLDARLPPSAPENADTDPRGSQRRSEPRPRPTPAWAHTQPLDLEEAA